MTPPRPPGPKRLSLGAATARAAAGLLGALTPQRALEAVRRLEPAARSATRSPGAVQLRRAHAADLAAWRALQQDCGLGDARDEATLDLPRRWADLEAAGGQLWLAERDGELLGALTLYLLPLLTGGGRAGWADDLLVRPQAHHLGIARRLIAQASEVARQAGADKLALSPRPKAARQRAGRSGRGFLEKLSYARHGRRLELPPAADGAG
ncbi:MAG: GNAT family N-acetyltransferase [Burkholderiaceae bacterium]|nr:GNAT family N-acetyltransferase [Burkholderiaceae bacterium]